MFAQAKRGSEMSGKPTLFVMFDMYWCQFRYGTSFTNYLSFGFYSLPKAKRLTFITNRINHALCCKLNEREYWPIFNDKAQFGKVFDDFIIRDWLDLSACTTEEFAAFIERTQKVFLKPADSSCGIGIRKLDVNQVDDPAKTLASLRKEGIGLAEEFVPQHDELAAIHPNALNTIRIVTIRNESGIDFLFAVLRIGRGDALMDNFNSGGMSAKIDIETGLIIKPAQDMWGNVHSVHPETGAQILGTKIPRFDEVMDMIRRAAEVVPQIRYIGWDIAVRNDGVEIIEGNIQPGNNPYQLPTQLEDSTGELAAFKKYLE